MNNKVFIFTTGLLIGGVSAWFATKEYYKNFMESEMNGLKDYYEDKFGVENGDDILPEPIEDVEKVEEELKEKIERIAKPDAEVEPDYDEIIEKLNYNRYSTKTSSLNNKPQVISMEEYNDDNAFDKKILSYFPEDETLMDSETEEVMENVNKVIGIENLEALSLNSEHNEIYVRNDIYGCDYQIILESGSYADFINEDF